MHYKIFPNPTIEAKHRSGLLGAHFDCFVARMRDYGYSRCSMRSRVQHVTRFGRYLKKRGVRSIRHLGGIRGQKLLRCYYRYCVSHQHKDKIPGVKLYVRALVKAGVITGLPPKDSLLLPITQQYVSFLKKQKGLSEATIRHHIYWIEKLLYSIGYVGGKKSLRYFGIVDVDTFVKQESMRLKRSAQKTLIGVLRSFMRFLYQSGILTTDISFLITSPRCYKLESYPQVLNWKEIEKTLNSIDKSTKRGLRDYVILILLSTYGLRAGEIARLRLDDINWKRETIHVISKKTARDLLLPLTPQVGKAIFDYLKKGRPDSKYREIFFLTRAPWTPLKGTNISYVVNRYIQLAGLDPPRGGAYLIRHSVATHLFRNGVPLKQVGDMLGHRDPTSTYVYIKTATENLRTVALEVPEVK